MFKQLKDWAKELKRKIFVLYLASKDPRVPWYAKVFAICVAAYAFSPVDLIPDFIPVLGYLDDIILIPLGIMLALKMIPKNVLAECEIKALEMMNKGKPKNWIAGSIIMVIWFLILIWILKMIYFR